MDVPIETLEMALKEIQGLKLRLKSLEDTEREISKYIHMFFEISEIMKKVKP